VTLDGQANKRGVSRFYMSTAKRRVNSLVLFLINFATPCSFFSRSGLHTPVPLERAKRRASEESRSMNGAYQQTQQPQPAEALINNLSRGAYQQPQQRRSGSGCGSRFVSTRFLRNRARFDFAPASRRSLLAALTPFPHTQLCIVRHRCARIGRY
jgi:hypothetical protein